MHGGRETHGEVGDTGDDSRATSLSGDTGRRPLVTGASSSPFSSEGAKDSATGLGVPAHPWPAHKSLPLLEATWRAKDVAGGKPPAMADPESGEDQIQNPEPKSEEGEIHDF